MSKKNGVAREATLPEILRTLVDKAHSQTTPKESEEDRATLPLLSQLLMPMRIDDPWHKGEGKAKQVWREPLLMVSFDRSQGNWKVAVGDKLFKLTTSAWSESLTGSLTALEASLRDNSAFVREKY